MDAATWAPLAARHRAFWRAEPGVLLKEVGTHHPLREGGGVPLADGRRAREGELITPDVIEPQRFYGPAAAVPVALQGDFVVGPAVPHLCWTEAIVGCPVRVVTGGPWAEPAAGDWRDLERLQPDRAWWRRLDAFVDLLVTRTAGHQPVLQPLMRGPVDMMAAAVGHAEMCLALAEEPDLAAAYLERCTTIFIDTARRRLARTPAFAGGFVCAYGIWAPDLEVRTQVDNASMLSPAIYARQVLPHDRRIMEAFPYTHIHLHSCCMHVVDALLEVEALKAIQVSIDYPGGPLAAAIMPVLRRVVGRKALIVTGPVTPAELVDLEQLAEQGSVCLRVDLVQEGGWE
jgi:hypothetical protein